MKNKKGGSIRNWLKSIMFKGLHGMMTCKEFEDFVQAYFDDELSPRQSAVFARHMRLCRECRDYLTAYQRTIEIGRSVLTAAQDKLPEEVPEDLIEAILKARQQQ